MPSFGLSSLQRDNPHVLFLRDRSMNALPPHLTPPARLATLYGGECERQGWFILIARDGNCQSSHCHDHGGISPPKCSICERVCKKKREQDAKTVYTRVQT